MHFLQDQEEVELLLRVIQLAIQPNGWKDLLKNIDDTCGCRTYLNAFTPDGRPADLYGGQESGRELAAILGSIETEGGLSAHQFLLQEASLKYPYCKSNLQARFGTKTSSGLPVQAFREDKLISSFRPIVPLAKLNEAPGFLSIIRKSGDLELLFACLIVDDKEADRDVAATGRIFARIQRIVEAGLAIDDALGEEKIVSFKQRLLMEAPSAATVIVNRDLNVIAATATAAEALEKTRAARILNGSLKSRNKELDANLAKALQDSSADNAETLGSRSHQTAGSDTIEMFIKNAETMLCRIVIHPVRELPGTIDDGPWLVVGTYLLADVPIDVQNVLQSQFGLSQTEANLARLLTVSASMTQTVETLGITRNTGKTHLRRIFEKTGTKTQLELAILMRQLAGLY
ncbi:hypothetical protein E1180_06560 [Roseibium denhamense]|uniref:DNA-binding transcriptional regulator, CsgD family n=1 Tax=Roseibium denhamense TaxID=76305 RepID=A0ABY1P451_9HYPH|nr:hypothetical protein [Roseibium denhamense]MTI05173.1 hypothetical protein [Roseibium denhamense]SMP25881.1 DNA-binding transcriptional regulator, CsgD family [Roseibium denhamense]